MVPKKLIKVLGNTGSLDFPFEWAQVIAIYHSIHIYILCHKTKNMRTEQIRLATEHVTRLS